MPLDLPFRPAPTPVSRFAVLGVSHSGWTALALALAGVWFQPADAAETGAGRSSSARSGSALAAKPAPEDPMDALREKLAARLGAQKATDSRNPNVLRVDNHAAPAPAAALSGSTAAASMAPRPTSRPGPGPGPAPQRAAAPAAETQAARPAHTSHWDYSGEGGPEAWGHLKPEYSKCSTGQRQSPIDIRGGIAVQLEPIQFDYRTSGFSVIDNGHTVQVN
ncbi:MAG TPA: carbonic anhydrase family protein, partial [Ideonella sp.]|nr:carbonic anhydrase family protein [Ideonella sp.]